MAQNLWVTIDGSEMVHVRTEFVGHCGHSVSEVFRARKLNQLGGGSRLEFGKNTPRMLLRIERVEGRGIGPSSLYHCVRLDTLAPRQRQGGLFGR